MRDTRTEDVTPTSSAAQSMATSSDTDTKTSTSEMGSAFSTLESRANSSQTPTYTDELLERKRTMKEQKQEEGLQHDLAQVGEETVGEQTMRKKMVRMPEEKYAALKEKLSQRGKELEEFEKDYKNLEGKARRFCDTIAKQNQDLVDYQTVEAWLARIVRRYLKPYAKDIGLPMEEWSLEGMRTVIERLHQDAVEAKGLVDHVQVLQKELLVKVDKAQAAPDGQFALDFRAIASAVKALSRTTRVTDMVDPDTMLGSQSLLENVSPHHWADRGKKKCLIEAWIWSVLDKHIFKSPFAILGELCEELRSVWHHLFLDDHSGSWPKPTTLSETWRCTTLERMMALVDCGVITTGEPANKNERLESSILHVRKKVKDEIQAGFASLSGSPSPAKVQSIVDRSFTLAMKMSVQRYRLQITYPAVGDLFNKDEMVAVLQADDVDIVEGTVAFVINPGLTKWGDTHGDLFDQRYDIVPALVQLNPLTIEEELANISEDLIRGKTSEARATYASVV